MGVAGSGKTTIGRLVAGALDWPYFEADDFHSAENIAKMGRGEPLNDQDREPWLAAIRAKMDACRAAGQSAVFTCSALKEQYRTRLGVGAADVLLVHLTGDRETLLARLGQRQGHYMKSAMLESQLAALEPPRDALMLDVSLPPAEIVQRILRQVRGAE
jgi:gluconokinase